jgi:HK97 family phage major capsid protein
VEISEQLLQDEQVDLSDVLLRAFVQSISARIDYACFVGDNTDDTVSGAQLGIFQDGSVASVNADVGNSAVSKLQREDFLNAVGAVTPAALQRPCRWFISPAFLPILQKLRDGATGFLLKSPLETGGEWALVGYPVTWVAQAPSANTPGSKIAAFGQSDAYLVGVREDFEIGSSQHPLWNRIQRQIRGYARARCDMRESTGWATLKLAAN